MPAEGPLAFQVPDISNVQVFLDVLDPVGDDHGPGSYTYPTDTVFGHGSYDLTTFEVGTEEQYLVLTFEVSAAIGNPWGSPSGLSVQTFDVYVDTDPGAGTGSRQLIPGRNAALEEGFGWEYGITIEGWEPAVYVADPRGSWEVMEPSMSVAVFGDQGKVVVRVPIEVLGEGDPTAWGYAMVVLSQEGFPSPGVRRVRDISAVAEQWRGGGAPNDLNHTRIFDVAWAAEGEQESRLSDYRSVTGGSIDDLSPDDFATLPLLFAG
jgi:carbohydrate-binding DOMON domain-containing protein